MPPQENQNLDQFNRTPQAPLEPEKIPEPKSNKAVVVVLGVLVVVLLGVVGYLSFTKMDNPLNPIVKEDALKEENASVADDWQTYKNDEYGFEFQYPHNLIIMDRSYVTPGGGVFPSLKIVSLDGDKDEQFITVGSKVPSSTAPDISCEPEFTKCKEFGKNIVYTKSLSDFILNTFDVVASTFKSKTENPGTLGWQTYKNVEIGLSFSYPDSYHLQDEYNIYKDGEEKIFPAGTKSKVDFRLNDISEEDAGIVRLSSKLQASVGTVELDNFLQISAYDKNIYYNFFQVESIDQVIEKSVQEANGSLNKRSVSSMNIFRATTVLVGGKEIPATEEIHTGSSLRKDFALFIEHNDNIVVVEYSVDSDTLDVVTEGVAEETSEKTNKYDLIKKILDTIELF